MIAKVGDRVQDCDPRSSHRTGTITEVLPNGCRIRWSTGKSTLVITDRLHTKGIKSGVRLLSEAEAETLAKQEASNG